MLKYTHTNFLPSPYFPKYSSMPQGTYIIGILVVYHPPPTHRVKQLVSKYLCYILLDELQETFLSLSGSVFSVFQSVFVYLLC